MVRISFLKIVLLLRMTYKSIFQLLPLSVLVVVLSACETLPTGTSRPSDIISPDEAGRMLEQRQQQLQEIARWQFNGRFSFLTEGEAWSGRLHWQRLFSASPPPTG